MVHGSFLHRSLAPFSISCCAVPKKIKMPLCKRLRAFEGHLSVIGGMSICLAAGSLYSYSNMIPYILSYRRVGGEQDVTYKGAVIGSGLLFGLSCLGSICGILLEKRYGVIKSAVLGCALCCLSMFASAGMIYLSYGAVIFTYAGIFGFSTGLSAGPTVVGAMKWFPEKRGLMSGLLWGSSGLGPVLFNFLQTKFINPKNISPDEVVYEGGEKELFFTEESAIERVPACILLQGGVIGAMATIGVLLLSEPRVSFPEGESIELQESNSVRRDPAATQSRWHNNDSEQRRLILAGVIDMETSAALAKCHTNTIQAHEQEQEVAPPLHRLQRKSMEINNTIPDKANQFDNDSHWSGLTFSTREAVKLLYTWQYVCIFSTCSFSSVVFIGLSKAFGQFVIQDDLFLATVGSVASLCNFLGHIIVGYAVDHFPLKVVCLVTSGLLSFSLLSISTTFLGGKFMYFIWVCIIFATNGGNFAIVPVFSIRVYGATHFDTNYALIMAIGSAALVIGAFLTTTILFAFSWSTMFIFLGIPPAISMVFGMFMNMKNVAGHDI